MKKQKLLGLVALMGVAGLVLGQSALAQGSLGAPNANNATKAVFNSVTSESVKSGTVEAIDVTADDVTTNNVTTAKIMGQGPVDLTGVAGVIKMGGSLDLLGNLVSQRTIYAKQSISTGESLTVRGRLMSRGLDDVTGQHIGGGLWLDDKGDQFIGDASVASPLSSATGFWINNGWRLIVNAFGQISNPNGDVGINDDLNLTGALKNDQAGGKVMVNDDVEVQNTMVVKSLENNGSKPNWEKIGLAVDGRISSGNLNDSQGGMWVNNYSMFVGAKGADAIGFYHTKANRWPLSIDRLGHTTVDGALTINNGVILNGSLNAQVLNSVISANNLEARSLDNGSGNRVGGNILAQGKIETQGDIIGGRHIAAVGTIQGSKVMGRCNFSPGIFVGTTSINCQDVAEVYPASEKTAAGDLLMLDNENPGQMKLATRDGQLTGVVSTSAGVILSEKGPVMSDGNNDEYITDSQTLMVLTGKAPVKVNLENGPIKAGDYITASSTPGVGMKANVGDQVVGIAMQDFNSAKTGTVLMLSDKSGAVNQLKDLLESKIQALENRLLRLESLLGK